MLEVITKRGTLSLALVGTGVASMTTCSIEGGVLNMGYVVAGESTSAGFQVKRVAGTWRLPRLLGGVVPQEGVSPALVREPVLCRPLPPHPPAAPPRPSLAGEAEDAHLRPHLPGASAAGPPASGLLRGLPHLGLGAAQLRDGSGEGPCGLRSPGRAARLPLAAPQGLRDVATLGWSRPQDTCFPARFSPGPDGTAQARDSRECFMGGWGALSGRG